MRKARPDDVGLGFGATVFKTFVVVRLSLTTHQRRAPWQRRGGGVREREREIESESECE